MNIVYKKSFFNCDKQTWCEDQSQCHKRSVIDKV